MGRQSEGSTAHRPSGCGVGSNRTADVPSAQAPLRGPLFRALRIAAFASNIGTWMQNVAAAWGWQVMPNMLKDPEPLPPDWTTSSNGKDATRTAILHPRRSDDGQLAESICKRTRYQEMSAEGFALQETARPAERELRALKHHTQHLERLERDRDSVLESYASLLPEAIDALGPEERY